MKVVILHDAVPEGAGPDQNDVLFQAQGISEVLFELGHDPVELNVSLNLNDLLVTLKELRPGFVFNLVESIRNYGRFIHFAPSILDHLRIPYSGSKTEALFMTSNKLTAKKLLHKANIPTSPGITVNNLKNQDYPVPNGLYIIKSVWEHASCGIDENSVVEVENSAQLLKAITQNEKILGGECLAERYIEGREFNLSLLASDIGPEVLPPGEILFKNYPPEKRRVVCYHAKWVEGSFEYLNTPRTFEFSSRDYPLLRKLKHLAKKCWHLFELNGYARVDFRVDETNFPWVLEINANPCISPDSGYIAAAEQAGLSMKKVIERIIEDSIPRTSFLQRDNKVPSMIKRISLALSPLSP